MTVIAILNSKGGSGKSTLATNLASWFALQGEQVMLGDMDRQQSVRAWLSKRPPQLPAITTWTRDDNKVFRAPPGTTRVILDTPGALYDHQLARVLVWVDAVIVPVGPSLFDVATFVPFYESLRQIPRVRSQRCAVMAIGMRWEPGKLDRWRADPATRKIPLITVLEEHHSYPRACAQGKGIFDLPKDQVPARCVRQWEPIFSWIDLQARRQQVSRQQLTAPTRGQSASSSLTSGEVRFDTGTSTSRAPATASSVLGRTGSSVAMPAQRQVQASEASNLTLSDDQPGVVVEGVHKAHVLEGDKDSRSWWDRLAWRGRSK